MDPSVYSEQIRQLVDACHYISAKGLTSSSGGNLSLRLADGNVLITPTGMPKEQVTADKICILDAAGRTLFCPEGCSPTSETPFHIMALSRRPDIVSVVHAHPVMLSAFAVAQTHLLEFAYYPEEAMEIGPIVKVPYDAPSCTKLTDRLSEYIHLSNGFLLENHGAVVLSQLSVSDAVERMYMIEATAKSVFYAYRLGALRMLTRDEVKALESLKELRGLSDGAVPISEAFSFEE